MGQANGVRLIGIFVVLVASIIDLIVEEGIVLIIGTNAVAIAWRENWLYIRVWW